MRSTKLQLLLAGALLVLAPAFAGAVVIEFDPSATVVQIGETFDVDVVVSDIGGPFDVLSAFDFDVDYDASILNATGVTFGLGLGFPLSIPGALLFPGHIDAFEVSLAGYGLLFLTQPDSFTIATLTFEALAPGLSSLSLTSPGLFAVEGLLGIEGVSVTAEGTVQVIPEPATAALLLIGVIGIASRTRRS